MGKPIYSSRDKGGAALPDSLVGGKAKTLFAFSRCAPPFFVLTLDFFRAFSFPLNAEAQRAILTRLKKNGRYAVRSSCVGEDGEFSFAGVHESFLNVKKEDVIARIEQCRQSAFSAEAAEYRRLNGISGQPQMAVIVQEMVRADFAGIINTVNPATDNPDELVISAVKGLAEQLCQGEMDGTDYYINGGKVKICGEDILGERLVKALTRFAFFLCAKAGDDFLDIEFAVKGKKIYFLQARPIRRYAFLKGKKRTLTADNANVIESYSGPCAPLTRSFAAEVYGNVYRQTVKEGGVGKKSLERLEPYFKNMLCACDERLYYNLNSWYTLTAALPGKSLAHMERMMGVKTSMRAGRIKFSAWDLCKIALNFLKRLKSLKKDSEAFLAQFYSVVYPYAHASFEGYDCKQLVETYERIARDTLSGFVVPVVNDCGAMFAYGRLSALAQKEGISAGEIASMVSGAGQVESALSAQAVEEVLQGIAGDGALKRDFTALSAGELQEKYAQTPPFSLYLQKYGCRVPHELKLETVTFLEDARPFFEFLKNAAAKREAGKSGAAFKSANSGQAGAAATGDRAKPSKRLQRRAEKAKYYIRNRERLRFTRTYTFSAVRRLFLRIGENFLLEGLLSQARDIFFLTKDEIFAYIKENKTADFKALVAQRKESFLQSEQKPEYSRIAYYGDAELKVRFASLSFDCIPSGQGEVTAKVKRVDDPSRAAIDGEIILAKSTDPGWIPLFARCSGLIVEHGSVLSHSAVVAREMGIPAVTGYADALDRIPDGATVYLNGNTGEVRILG